MEALQDFLLFRHACKRQAPAALDKDLSWFCDLIDGRVGYEIPNSILRAFEHMGALLGFTQHISEHPRLKKIAKDYAAGNIAEPSRAEAHDQTELSWIMDGAVHPESFKARA